MAGVRAGVQLVCVRAATQRYARGAAAARRRQRERASGGASGGSGGSGALAHARALGRSLGGIAPATGEPRESRGRARCETQHAKGREW
jgi:hypothetical protein